MMSQSPRSPKPGQFRDSTLGVPGQTTTWVWARWSNAGREVAALSSIRIIDEVQRGEVMPHDGGIIRPKNVQMKPFFPKGELNS
jgi:hypothetical protein